MSGSENTRRTPTARNRRRVTTSVALPASASCCVTFHPRLRPLPHDLTPTDGAKRTFPATALYLLVSSISNQAALAFIQLENTTGGVLGCSDCQVSVSRVGDIKGEDLVMMADAALQQLSAACVPRIQASVQTHGV